MLLWVPAKVELRARLELASNRVATDSLANSGTAAIKMVGMAGVEPALNEA